MTLMLITCRHIGGPDWIERVIAAADAGVDCVQLRDKDLPHDERLALLEKFDALLPAHVKIFFNSATPPECSGRIYWHAPYQSIHSVDEVRSDVPYLIVGTIYPTDSKPGHPGAGVEIIRACRAATPVPLYAVGGITIDRVDEVLNAGASGVAVIRAILGARDPAHAAHLFKQRITALTLGAHLD